MLKLIMIVAVLALLATAAQAGPLVTLPDLSIGGVAAAGGNPGIGACLTYPLLKAANGDVFCDLGILMDGQTYDGFLGLSTDRLIPLVEQLPGAACTGVGYCWPSETWMLYLRYELF